MPSAALGSNGATVLDMASAYDTLAGDGVHTEPVFVTPRHDRDGTVLYEAPTDAHRVLSETTARTVNGVLQQVVNRGTGVNARIGRPVAGKTGTSDEWADAWFVGYTPELVTAVWVGFPRRGAHDAPADDPHHRDRRLVAGADLAGCSSGAALAETPITGFPRAAPPATTTTTTDDPAVDPNRPPLLSVVGHVGRERDPGPARRRATGARLRYRPSRELPAGHGASPRTRRPAGRPGPGSLVTITVAERTTALAARAERARRLRRRGRGDAARRGLRGLDPRAARAATGEPDAGRPGVAAVADHRRGRRRGLDRHHHRQPVNPAAGPAPLRLGPVGRRLA